MSFFVSRSPPESVPENHLYPAETLLDFAGCFAATGGVSDEASTIYSSISSAPPSLRMTSLSSSRRGVRPSRFRHCVTRRLTGRLRRSRRDRGQFLAGTPEVGVNESHVHSHGGDGDDQPLLGEAADHARGTVTDGGSAGTFQKLVPGLDDVAALVIDPCPRLRRPARTGRTGSTRKALD